MAITKHFRETVMQRARVDHQFRREMLREAVEALLNDEIDLAKSLLRDYINATIQFATLASQLHKDTKSLQRMFGASGNPTARNLFAVIHALQDAEGVRLKVSI
jgi:hypothetical protein